MSRRRKGRIVFIARSQRAAQTLHALLCPPFPRLSRAKKSKSPHTPISPVCLGTGQARSRTHTEVFMHDDLAPTRALDNFVLATFDQAGDAALAVHQRVRSLGLWVDRPHLLSDPQAHHPELFEERSNTRWRTRTKGDRSRRRGSP
jgi:hypothetical protein